MLIESGTIRSLFISSINVYFTKLTLQIPFTISFFISIHFRDLFHISFDLCPVLMKEGILEVLLVSAKGIRNTNVIGTLSKQRGHVYITNSHGL